MEEPLVTIIMPSYNTVESILLEAINSILKQTYKKYEFIIIDDGSENLVEEVMENICDDRIIILRNEKNCGLVFSLNLGINSARGKYIFRMDSDDISVPNRLERQVHYFENHPDIDIVSSYAKTFGTKGSIYKSCITNVEIKSELLWKNPIVHPTVAFRTESLRRHNIHYSMLDISEDFGLWSLLAFEVNFRFEVIPEVLLLYRIHPSQLTQTKGEVLLHDEGRIIKKNMENLAIDLSDDEFSAYMEFRNSTNYGLTKLILIIKVLHKIIILAPNQISKQSLKRRYRVEFLKSMVFILKKWSMRVGT